MITWTKRLLLRLAGRTMRVASKSIAAIPAEVIPFIGLGVLIVTSSSHPRLRSFS